MSILLKRMEIPTARDTRVLVRTDGTALVYEDEAYVTTAAPVPKHGRLIDGDELAAGCDAPHWCRWLSEIEDSPTIIPPSEEGE